MESVVKMEGIAAKLGQYLNEITEIIAQVERMDQRFQDDRKAWDSELFEAYFYESQRVLFSDLEPAKRCTEEALTWLRQYVKNDQELYHCIHLYIKDDAVNKCKKHAQNHPN